jgi:hypothetical protein
MIGPLRVAQVISLGLIAVGVLILYFKVRNAPRYNVK